MTRRFVVTGTDTGIGKTVFSAALTGVLDGCYWKPVQSGLIGPTDSEAVVQLSGLPAGRILPEAYKLNAPLSPHRAAELDGVSIDVSRLEPPDVDRPLVIEGAGGLLVPIKRELLYADVFARWELPVILCARTTLGTINHSLLSIESMRLRDINIHGIAFIGSENEDSERTICEIGGVRMLGRLPHVSPLDTAALAAAFASHFRPEDFA